MKHTLESIELRGLTVFSGADPVLINLRELGPGLVALVGRNGSGKTTAMEAVPGALWGMLPSRKKGKSLFDYANARDAYIELCFYGDLKIRRTIDAVGRKGEAFAWDGPGSPLNDGKLTTFDKVVEELFGSSRLFLASIFAAQNRRGNILELDRSERKALFAELLNLGRFADLKAIASGRATNVADAISAQAGLRQALEATAEGRVEIETAKLLNDDQVGRLATDLEEARTKLKGLEHSRDQAEAGSDRLLHLAETSDRAADRVQEIRKASEAETSRRKAATEKLDAQRQAADERIKIAEADLVRAGRTLAGEEAVLKATEAEGLLLIESEPAMGRAKADLPELAAERKALEALLQVREVGIAAEDNLETEVRHLEEDLAKVRRRLELKDRVPCTKAEAWSGDLIDETRGYCIPEADLAGNCPLLHDAREAELEVGLAEKALEAAREKLEDAALKVADGLAPATAAKARIQEIKELLPELERLAARLPGVEAAKTRIVEAVERVDRARERFAEDEKKIKERLGIDGQVRHDLTTEAGKMRKAPLDGQLALDLLEAEAQAGDALGELEEGKKAEVPAPADWELTAAESTIKEYTDAEVGAIEERGRISAKLIAIGEAETKLSKLDDGLELELEDWRLLELALGPDGIPNVLIDAAGPEVAAIVNQLLEVCWSGRFRVEFRTLKKLKRKSGGAPVLKEDFSILVFDNGVERDVEDLSGGERAIVGEALSLAAAEYNARKSGVSWGTLFRDETAGALDPESARFYPAMLRRALELGGFDQVVFIAHAPEVFEAADAQVHFDAGKVTIAGGA